MKKRSFSGMTLVEIMVTVAIIGFLIMLAFWAFSAQRAKGIDARRKADIHKIAVGVEEYEKDNNCYPLPQLVTCDPGTALRPYTDLVPCDPSTNASYYYEYEDSSCPSWYRLYAIFENEADPEIDELGCTNGCGPGLAFDYYASSPNAPSPEVGTGGSGGSEPPPPPDPSKEFYGCFSGACTPINWDPGRPGPECDPNYQNPTCYGQCGPPETECTPWGQ